MLYQVQGNRLLVQLYGRLVRPSDPDSIALSVSGDACVVEYDSEIVSSFYGSCPADINVPAEVILEFGSGVLDDEGREVGPQVFRVSLEFGTLTFPPFLPPPIPASRCASGHNYLPTDCQGG